MPPPPSSLPITARSSIAFQSNFAAGTKPQSRCRCHRSRHSKKLRQGIRSIFPNNTEMCVVCEILQGTKCMHNRNARIRVKRSLKRWEKSKVFIQVRSKRISLRCPRSSSSPVRSSNTAALLHCCCSSCRRSFHVHCCGAHLLEWCASCCSSVG